MILAAAVNPETYSNADDQIAGLQRGDPEAITAVLSLYQHRLSLEVSADRPTFRTAATALMSRPERYFL
jgi:hypothetical protein